MLSSLERYELRQKVGEGGFGRVYLGWDLKLKRDVAIKVLARSENSVREAVVMAKLSHPNIVRVYDIVEGTDSIYIVMEYIDGQPVDALSLREEQIIEIGIKLCSGLGYAHQRGVIHRDIKPENVILEGNQPKITDFGIAIWRESPNGQVMGTPKYMAPEQKRKGQADNRSDIYSLGMLLLELVDRCGESVTTLLRKIITKATALNPEKRYQSMAEMEEALRDVLPRLKTHKACQWILPDLEEGVSHLERMYRGISRLHPRLVFSALASLTTYFLLQSPFVDQHFYAPIFSQVIAPLFVAFLSYLVLPLGTTCLYLLVLLPLMAANPSLGLFAFLWFVPLVFLIYKYPKVFVLLGTVGLNLPVGVYLATTVVLSVSVRFKAGMLFAILYPWISSIRESILLSEAFANWLNSPNPIFQFVHLTEYYQLCLSFFESSWLEIALLLVISSLAAIIMRKRLFLGQICLLISTGFFSAFSNQVSSWQYLLGLCLVFCWSSFVYRPQLNKKNHPTKRISLHRKVFPNIL